jgi:hypothetical protein
VAAINQRYQPLIRDMQTLDPARPSTMQRPAQELVKIMRESGVAITPSEGVAMLSEVARNKEKAYKSVSNVVAAVNEFRRKTNK